MIPKPLPVLETITHKPFTTQEIKNATDWMKRKLARSKMHTMKARTGAHIPMGKSKKYKVIPTD